MDLGLEGKFAIVTGGSRGIGLATSAVLVREGCSVVICARDPSRLEAAARELEQIGAGAVVAVEADASVAQDLDNVVEMARAAFERVDILVNNVGTSFRRAFLETTDEDWERDLNLKVFSTIRLVRRVVPLMPERGGRIVNVLNTSHKHPPAESGPTSVTRAAGHTLTKLLSKELASRGILVNAVSIGLIKSGQHDDRFANVADEMSRDGYYDQLARSRGVPLGRAGEADEAANVIAFLVSEAASYVTGTAINIDGGSSATT